MSEERAVALLQSAAVGTVLTLLGQPPQRRDLGLSETAREGGRGRHHQRGGRARRGGARGAAVALGAALERASVLTAGEKHLLEELLRRIADAE
jgi:hypothetical protein